MEDMMTIPLGRYGLENALRLYDSQASSNGAADGSTIVDASLISSNDFLTGKTVKIGDGPANREEQVVSSFDNTTGTMTFTTHFSVQITVLAHYSVLAQAGAPGTSTLKQSDILSDATPFPGADIALIKAKTDLLPADTTTQLDTNIPAIKAETDQIGTVVNTGGTATLAALLGDMANVALAARIIRLMAQSFSVPQPAAYTATVTVTTGSTNLALGSITIAGIPAGATVAHLFVHFLFGERADTSAALNSLSGAQNLQVQKNAGAFSTFFSFAGGEYSTAASAQAGGDAKKGTVDLVALAPANGDVLTFQWTGATSVGNDLVFAEFEVIVELAVTP
jgi:hypothetical protein